MKILLTEVKIVINPCDLLAPLPRVAVYLNEDVRKKEVSLKLADLHTEVHLLEDDRLATGGFDLHEVIAVQSFMSYSLQSVTDQLRIDFRNIYKLFDKRKVTQLAGLIDAIRILVEPPRVVLFEAFKGRIRVPDQKHERNDGSSSPSLPVIAMHRDHSLRKIYIIRPLPLRYLNISYPICMRVVSGGA